MKTTTTIYGRRHIHGAVKRLAEWKKKKNPRHTISDEYDELLIAGIKATYGQELPMEAPQPEIDLNTAPKLSGGNTHGTN